MEPKSLDPVVPALGRQRLDRLKRRAEFQRVSRGRRRAYEAFTLQSAPRPVEETADAAARIGFTVTKKVGVAVVRNRIRRRLKAALAAAAPLETRADCDYVLMARREALQRPFAALVDDLRQAFRAVGRNGKDGGRQAPSNPPTGKNRRP
jgi:ribonuclease P protein component